MEFYISSDGEKRGPLSMFRVTQMLDDKEINGQNLAWTQGQDGWLPLEEVPAFSRQIRRMKKKDREAELGPDLHLDEIEETTTAVAKEKKVIVSHEVRPFTRFWARSFDYTMVMVLVVMFVETPKLPADLTVTDLLTGSAEYLMTEEFVHLARMQLIALWSWHLIEGLLIWLIGTTPGKALFSIRVASAEPGTRIPILKSMGRSIYVLLAGFGMGYGFLPFIGMTMGFFRLLASGRTLWDQHLKLTTQHAPMGPVRILIAIGAFIALMALQSWKLT